MIKNYLNLNIDEKNLACEFISRKHNDKKSIEEIDQMFNCKIYDYGVGALFYFQGDKLIGKGCVVLEVAGVLNTAFIHFIDILEEADNRDIVLKELIDESSLVATKYGAKKIKLGIRDGEILSIAEKLNLHKSYSAYIMTLDNRSVREEVLGLVPLSDENMEEYIEVFNDSFNDMPHGSFIDIIECKKYLENVSDENYYFMVCISGVNIGFMNCIIKDGRGSFDIGLCKKYRGNGYGSRLLETAIDFLNRKKVDKISITVIEQNRIAYKMYKKRGFKIESTLSTWIEIL